MSDGAAGFAELFRAALGQTAMAGAALQAGWIDTPLGGMVAVTDAHRLHLLEFADREVLAAGLRRLPGPVGLGWTALTARLEAQLDAYFAGRLRGFELPLAMRGTPFQCRVWQELLVIPFGQTISYAELAHRIDRPRAVRAVAQANGANRISLVIPCHRVIGANGTLTGYGGGLWRKRRLIALESGQIMLSDRPPEGRGAAGPGEKA
ncbi:methylated-DNA--[protein]-cysteine S-methyltransferase [Paracoccus sp. (in: a-proteobacteria)]|uniref:methylated-DNA--[protein]-cysteine S-methyltransferase n=1 Tax=Paracoccus sp. TaxID=267 RepID=UPI0032204243